MPAIIRGGAAVEIYSGILFTDAQGVQRPSNWLELSTLEDRQDAGVLSIVEPPEAPKGKYTSITGLSIVDGVVKRTYEVLDVPTPTKVIPEFVSNYQARTALINAGLFQKADATIRGLGNLIALQAWDYANNFYRVSPVIDAIQAILELTDEQVDDLFITADKVT